PGARGHGRVPQPGVRAVRWAARGLAVLAAAGGTPDDDDAHRGLRRHRVRAVAAGAALPHGSPRLRLWWARAAALQRPLSPLHPRAPRAARRRGARALRRGGPGAARYAQAVA